MNYAIRLDKYFEKTEIEQVQDETIFKDIEDIETDILTKIVGNDELQNFIYPVLTTYTDADKIKVINKEFGTECDTINKFHKDTVMKKDMIIRVINNINNYIVINTASNLNKFYEEVYLCNLYYDNPAHNIHYIVCKNKIAEMETLEILINNVCLNSNNEHIYNYLICYLSSINILMSIFNNRKSEDNIYSCYCEHFAINNDKQ